MGALFCRRVLCSVVKLKYVLVNFCLQLLEQAVQCMDAFLQVLTVFLIGDFGMFEKRMP